MQKRRLKPMFKAVDKHVSIKVNDFNGLNELQKTFVLVGVERGGTSMVAGVLRALGVHLGDKTGRNHEDHNFQNDDEKLLLQYIEDNNSAHDVWGFKVPKASLKLDFYNKHLRNPYYVVVFRNISSVVDSWCSRGAVDPCQTALHAIHYYQKSIESVQRSGRPALFVSYERSCESIDELIHDLSVFCGCFPSKRMIVEATSMVTGDGGGYVNLSNRHFYVEELDASLLGGEEILLHPQTECFSDSDAFRDMIDYNVIKPLLNPLPEVIYLIFQLIVIDKKTLEGNKIRLYMNYDDCFFIGHGYCPVLREGRNVLKIEHHGNVKGFAFSGTEDGMTFSIVGIHLFKSIEL